MDYSALPLSGNSCTFANTKGAILKTGAGESDFSSHSSNPGRSETKPTHWLSDDPRAEHQPASGLPTIRDLDVQIDLTCAAAGPITGTGRFQCNLAAADYSKPLWHS